jgi:hypothetical protein
MRVWVVTRYYNYEGTDVLNVCSSSDKGVAYANERWYDKDSPLEFHLVGDACYVAHVDGGEFKVTSWDVE